MASSGTPGSCPLCSPVLVAHDLRRALWEVDRRQFIVPPVEDFIVEVLVRLLVVASGLLRLTMSS